jgi:hypothetical protein
MEVVPPDSTCPGVTELETCRMRVTVLPLVQRPRPVTSVGPSGQWNPLPPFTMLHEKGVYLGGAEFVMPMIVTPAGAVPFQPDS